MSHIIMLTPIGTNVSPTSISLDVIHAMGRKGIRLSVFKPIAQPRAGGGVPDQTTTIVYANSSTTTIAEPLKMSYVEDLLPSNQKDVLMEGIIANYHASTKGTEVVLVKGLVPTRKRQFTQSLSYEITKALNAEVVFVISQGTGAPEQLKEHIELARSSFGGAKNTNITDVIVNKLNTPVDEQGRTRPGLSEIFDDSTKTKVNNVDPAKLQESSPLPILGAIPWSFDLIATRAVDMARRLDAAIINEGGIDTRRVRSITFCAYSIPHMLRHFRTGSLLIASAGRPDVLVVACLAAVNGAEIDALLPTGGYEMDARVSKLRGRAFTTGLPVLMVNTNIWQASLSLQSFNLEVPVDGHERIEKVQGYVANYISADWIDSLTTTSERSHCLSPPAFHYQLTRLARKTDKRIVLPEGDEPRIVKAAAICAERGITACMLLGDPAGINRVTVSQGVELGADIEIVDPEVVRESYVDRLVKLCKNKGTTGTAVRKQLEDSVVLDTLMLEQDEVGGLVSGAVHTTANTIRPPLQLIKTVPGSSLVSSVFFMLLPERIYVYGGCTINPDPTAKQLAEIVIQPADFAAAFGIEPRIVMLPYSAGTSGAGSDVEKVCEATRLAQEKRPDLMIDDPLQCDAAVMADVVKSKASNSPVVGRATVSIFPDLDTGNTIYEVVQRSADLISTEPMLQGMRKPVDDLSRGALAGDIIYIVALAAVQSAQQQ